MLRHQQAGLLMAHQLGDSRNVASNYRQLHGHGFSNDIGNTVAVAVVFDQTGKHEQIGALIVIDGLGRGHDALKAKDGCAAASLKGVGSSSK